MEWKELYSRASKPRLAEIRAFMNPDAFEVFQAFSGALREKYNLGYVLPKYTVGNGWIYTYGRSGFILIKSVVFHADHFSVEGMNVYGADDLPKALALVDELFHDGFLERYAVYDAARTERRQQKKLLSTEFADEGRYKQQCIWPKKVSRNDLRKLYKSDALRMPDEDLLDDIGFTLYTRCKQAKEIYDMMEVGKIKCLHCGEIHQCTSKEGALKCACGRQYTYHAYRKSFREDNMPRGAASVVFDKFVADWENASGPNLKMMLIDSLIHECHVAVISGNTGRPVGVNLIQGTKSQIDELINELAYK